MRRRQAPFAASIETIADIAVPARALDSPIAARPPKANREWIARLLGVGVRSLHCPQVQSTEHAAEIVTALPTGVTAGGRILASIVPRHPLRDTARARRPGREIAGTREGARGRPRQAAAQNANSRASARNACSTGSSLSARQASMNFATVPLGKAIGA